MKKYLFVFTVISLFFSQAALAANGFYETSCYHNGEKYGYAFGDKDCPAIVVTNHPSSKGICSGTVSHPGLKKGVVGSTISSISCVTVGIKEIGTAHCTITRDTRYNDPHL